MFGLPPPYSMVVMIVVVVFAAQIWRTHMITRARMGNRSREDDALIGSMQAQIDRLTERVAVLEKLVTDDDRRLSREIDSLRGRPEA